MSNIPPLNYFMEQEVAQAAINSFRLNLQVVFKEYKKVWNLYMNLVKKCEDNNSRPLSKNKSKENQNDGNYKCAKNMYIDEQDIANSVHSMEDVLAQCTLDLNSSMEESNEGDRSEEIRRNVPDSPIFQRNNSNSAISTFRRSNSISGSAKSIIADNNLSENNEQENSDGVHPVINTSSTTNFSSIFLCSTPKKSQKWSKSKRQNITKSAQSKRIMSSGSLKKKNNLVSIRKEKTNKVPLQIINNVTSIPKNIYQMDKNNAGRSHNIELTMSPSSKKLKQTKLVFHKTKRTVELSSNLKSSTVSPTTKTNIPISDHEKILKQSSLTNNPNEKGPYNEYRRNSYDRVEINKGTMENNCVYIQTNPEIKNEVILQQEYEQINPPEINDPLNISNGSDSINFEEKECNIRPNENNDSSFDSDETYTSLMEDSLKNTNGNFKKKYIISLETERNIKDNDTEEPITKKRLAKLENENCNECKRNSKKHCFHLKSTPYKIRNVPTSSSTLLPDSSTT